MRHKGVSFCARAATVVGAVTGVCRRGIPCSVQWTQLIRWRWTSPEPALGEMRGAVNAAGTRAPGSLDIALPLGRVGNRPGASRSESGE